MYSMGFATRMSHMRLNFFKIPLSTVKNQSQSAASAQAKCSASAVFIPCFMKSAACCSTSCVISTKTAAPPLQGRIFYFRLANGHFMASLTSSSDQAYSKIQRRIMY